MGPLSNNYIYRSTIGLGDCIIRRRADLKLVEVNERLGENVEVRFELLDNFRLRKTADVRVIGRL